MGGSVSFAVNVDSPSKEGAKSVMSDAIDGLSAEQLVAGIEKYVRDGKTISGLETKVDVVDKDGGVLVSQHFEIPAFLGLGGGSHKCYMWYHFDAEKSMVEIRLYTSEVSFERSEPSTTSWIKVHSNPVTVESWVDYHEVQNSGLVMRAMMDKVLSEMGSSARSCVHEPSIGDPSKLSCVSTPIEDSSVTPDSFLDFFRGFLVDTMGATGLPDDSIIEERGAILGLSKRVFVRHVFDRDARHVTSYEFGEDESLQELQSITHCQAHKEPFRLEIWNVNKAGRRGGEAEKKLIEPLVNGVLKYVQAEG